MTQKTKTQISAFLATNGIMAHRVVGKVIGTRELV